MRTIDKLLAASVLALASAAPVFSAQAAEPLSQQLEERNTYTNPAQAGWTASAMETRPSAMRMRMHGHGWMPSTNVSPSSMNSGLEQQR